MRRSAVWVALSAALLSGCRNSARTDVAPTLTVEQTAVEPADAGRLYLPAKPLSVKFAVIGDSGRGSAQQTELAGVMASYRERFPFTFTLMLGDNIYEGPAAADDYTRKFERPYRTLLDAGVEFYAALGNHDDPNERFYAPFHMGGQPYYTFRPPGSLPLVGPSVRFFALDSTNFDSTQSAWLDRELSESDSEWKIVFLHHPLYSAGRYRVQAGLLRAVLEDLLVAHGVSVVFSGHEHLYQRSTLQRGIQYFISGGAGSVRRGDLRAARLLARGYDDDLHFMLVEIDGDELFFQTIARNGSTVDAGVIRRPPAGTEAHPQSLESSSQPAQPTRLGTAP